MILLVATIVLSFANLALACFIGETVNDIRKGKKWAKWKAGVLSLVVYSLVSPPIVYWWLEVLANIPR